MCYNITNVPMLLFASLMLAGCADQAITDQPIVDHDGAAVEAPMFSAENRYTKQSGDSRPTGPVPEIHVTGSSSASSGTGSITISQSGPGAQSSEDSATPTAVSWTPTTITVAYAGATETYDLTKDEKALFQEFQAEIGSTQTASRGGGSEFRAMLFKEGLRAEEVHEFFSSQGYMVRSLDTDRLEISGLLASRQEARANVVAQEIRHVFNVRTREIERSELYQDGVLVYTNGPSGSLTEIMQKAP